MKKFCAAMVIALLSSCVCRDKEIKSTMTLLQAREGFKTTLIRKEATGFQAEEPPETVFQKVQFPSAVGPLWAYVTPDLHDQTKHPAIIWLVGGFSNSIFDTWHASPKDNDQSAAAFREAGLIMMYPSLRGGNDNPGYKEGFYGEVNDVLAAAEYLAQLPYVDSQRIYLGGHSTGGTLALLVTEASNRFRATFALGPVDDIRGYGEEYLPFDISNSEEAKLRSPKYWLSSIQTPTFIIEGMSKGNLAPLLSMRKENDNDKVHFFPVLGATHFTLIHATNQLIAKKIVADNQPISNIEFRLSELAAPFLK